MQCEHIDAIIHTPNAVSMIRTPSQQLPRIFELSAWQKQLMMEFSINHDYILNNVRS